MNIFKLIHVVIAFTRSHSHYTRAFHKKSFENSKFKLCYTQNIVVALSGCSIVSLYQIH